MNVTITFNFYPAVSCWFVVNCCFIFSDAERPTIFFDSHDVSKPDSVSSLSVLDDSEKCDSRPFVNAELLNGVVAMLRVSFNMALFGVDIVVEKNTGHYAIIDINAFPGINK